MTTATMARMEAMIPKMMAMTSSEFGEIGSLVVGEVVFKANGVAKLYGLVELDGSGVGAMLTS